MAFLKKILKNKEEKSAKNKRDDKVGGKTSPVFSTSGSKAPRGIIRSQHIAEKSSWLFSKNKYVFKVSKDANKNLIKKAVEGKFGVKVERINIVNLPGHIRRRGSQIGLKPGIKKAIVTLRKGDTLEIK